MSKFLLPTTDETTIELVWQGSDKVVTIGLIELDILQQEVQAATKNTPSEFYSLLISQIKEEFNIELTKGQVWALLEKKADMFEVLKKSYLK